MGLACAAAGASFAVKFSETPPDGVSILALPEVRHLLSLTGKGKCRRAHRITFCSSESTMSSIIALNLEVMEARAIRVYSSRSLDEQVAASMHVSISSLNDAQGPAGGPIPDLDLVPLLAPLDPYQDRVPRARTPAPRHRG